MQYREYGKENADTIVLLHGGGLSWWNYREAAEILQNQYHVILPVLDGHAESDRHYTSIEDNAEEIIAFVDAYCGGRVQLLGGLSLGAQTALEILSRKKDIAEHALIESASVLPSKLTNALIGPAFGSSWGLVQSRKFAKLQFASLHMKEELFEDYYRDTCLITKEDMIAFMKANTSYGLKEPLRDTCADVHIYAGGKETGGILRSADLIHAFIPGSEKIILPRLYHGEFSINHPEQFASEAVRILTQH